VLQRSVELATQCRHHPSGTRVASVTTEAWAKAPQRCDAGALIACFQASLTALRNRNTSAHGLRFGLNFEPEQHDYREGLALHSTSSDFFQAFAPRVSLTRRVLVSALTMAIGPRTVSSFH